MAVLQMAVAPWSHSALSNMSHQVKAIGEQLVHIAAHIATAHHAAPDHETSTEAFLHSLSTSTAVAAQDFRERHIDTLTEAGTIARSL
jgi:hypothetical protein